MNHTHAQRLLIVCIVFFSRSHIGATLILRATCCFVSVDGEYSGFCCVRASSRTATVLLIMDNCCWCYSNSAPDIIISSLLSSRRVKNSNRRFPSGQTSPFSLAVDFVWPYIYLVATLNVSLEWTCHLICPPCFNGSTSGTSQPKFRTVVYI